MAKAATATAELDAPVEVVAKDKAAPTPEDPSQKEVSPVTRVARTMPKQLPPQDIQPAGARWNAWGIMAHADHTIEDVTASRYLWAKADQMKAGDYVEIKHPFGYYVICLDVVRIDHQARGIVANIRSIYDYTQPGAQIIKPSLQGARIEFLSVRGWAVVQDTHVVKDGFEGREKAEQWLDEQRYSR